MGMFSANSRSTYPILKTRVTSHNRQKTHNPHEVDSQGRRGFIALAGAKSRAGGRARRQAGLDRFI
jgi:hypothetical protein